MDAKTLKELALDIDKFALVVTGLAIAKAWRIIMDLSDVMLPERVDATQEAGIAILWSAPPAMPCCTITIYRDGSISQLISTPFVPTFVLGKQREEYDKAVFERLSTLFQLAKTQDS